MAVVEFRTAVSDNFDDRNRESHRCLCPTSRKFLRFTLEIAVFHIVQSTCVAEISFSFVLA